LEAVLHDRETPRLLHLATHGFFLKDQDPGALAETSDKRRKIQVSSTTAKPNLTIENPLLRSGIALAGANRTLQSGGVGNSDGIVTAEKVLGLRFRGTEMVVLSACDTGVGEVRAGEGVFGLRRAFLQAGAKSLVMSLWSVPDRETKELMIAFYTNIFFKKMKRSQALRQAALNR
jgi:CHAT domain-containing protein